MALETAQIVAQTIAAVKLAQAKATAAVTGIPLSEAIATFGISSVYNAVKEWVGGYSTSSVSELLAQSQRVDAWIAKVTTALGGSDSSYTLERWVRAGQALADISNSMSGAALDSAFFNRASADAKVAYETTKEALGTIASPKEWPWYAQAAVIGVGIFYASQIYKNFKGGK